MWVNAVMVAVQLESKRPAENKVFVHELFKAELNGKGARIYQKIALMAFYYKAINELGGSAGVFLNAGFTENGRIGSIDELKKWFRREEKMAAEIAVRELSKNKDVAVYQELITALKEEAGI